MKKKYPHLLQVPHFSPVASLLRQEFDTRFADPLVGHRGRFVWDYWHVPGQYNLLRTPAFEYFDEKLYQRFHQELVLWGRRQLGCWDISPPWMSCYVEGCKQELHSDVPHGPWAFVYSLTPQKVRFYGGETVILRPEVLNYWQNFSSLENRELTSFVERIPSRFNQLTVFDPRYPHGVTEVRGTQDPREARLVIHGWFTEPKTYLEGSLSGKVAARKTESVLNFAYEQCTAAILAEEACQGVLSLQLKVSATGRVTGFRWGTKNLLDQQGQVPSRLLKKIEKIYCALDFPKARGSSALTVPLIIS